MKKILAATDFSDRADLALARAMRLAADTGAAVSVLSVIPDGLPDKAHDQFLAAATVALDEQVSRIGVPAGLEVHRSVATGTDWITIVETADMGGFDLVVLGAHRPDLRGRAPGSTAERVVGHTGVPVLMVRDEVRGAYRHPVVAVDFSAPSRRVLRLASTLVADRPIAAVHAWDLPFKGFLASAESREAARQRDAARLDALIAEAFEDLRAANPAIAGRIEPVLRQGDPASAIEAEIEARGGDLLVIGTHGGSSFHDMMVGSVAEAFLTLPPCDVAVVPA